MLHPTEYLVLALLKKEINNIATDEKLLADMFSAFRCVPILTDLVGDNFYLQLIQLIQGQGKDRLIVKLAHLARVTKRSSRQNKFNESKEKWNRFHN
jgi:hypothetical protein